MVGRYIIEDEYTVNVRLLRDANIATYPNDPPLPLVTINRTKPNNCAKDEVPYRGITHYYNSNSSSPTFILECNEPYTLVRTDQSYDSTVTSRNSSPTITLLPPLDSHITSVNVTHHYNGVPENANIIVQGRNLGSSSECSVHHRIQTGLEPDIAERKIRRTISERHSNKQSVGATKEVNLSSESLQQKSKKKSHMNMLLLASDNDHNNELMDIDSVPSKRNSLNKSSKCCGLPSQFVNNVCTKSPIVSFVGEKEKVGHHELPSVHVFADDNTLVSKNSYARPKPGNDNLSVGSKPVAPGSLFVKPIKQHCSQGNGQLYVAPVDYQALLIKQGKQMAPFKGNSRRKRSGSGNNATTKDPSSPLKKYPSCQMNLPESEVSICVSPPPCDWDENATQNIINGESGKTCGPGSNLKPIQNLTKYGTSEHRLVDRRFMSPNYQHNRDRVGITSFTSILPTSSSSRYSNNDGIASDGASSSKALPKSSWNIKENDSYDSGIYSTSFINTYSDTENYRSQVRKISKENENIQCTYSSRNGSYNSNSPSKADARALITEVISDRLSTYLTMEQSKNEENNINKQNELMMFKSAENFDNSKYNKCAKLTRNGAHSHNEMPSRQRPAKFSHANQLRNGNEEPSVVWRARVPEKEVGRNRVNFIENPKSERPSAENPDCGAFTNGQGFNDPGEHLTPRSVKSGNRQTWPHFLTKSENMIVTKEPVIPSHLQLPSCNNNHLKEFSVGNPYLINERARKYLIDDSHAQYGGHPNLAYDSHDNLEFDQRIGFSSYGDICHFDPGYGSERSEEEESNSLPKDTICPPSLKRSPPKSIMSSSLMPPKGIDLSVDYLMGIFPFINEGTVFEVTIIRNSRGLGLAVTGGVEDETLPLPGLIRVKKLYPQTPAWVCGQLRLDDFLLEANGNQLTGLTSHEALEVLRTTGTEVHLVVCRPPRDILKAGGDDNLTYVDRRGHSMLPSIADPHFNFNYHQLSPSSSFSNCGEFEIKLQKVAGSLGFTLRKNDNSILGHTIRSLVKEPALSDGRIRPGDKLVSVNGTDMCGVSHEEAVRFLRTCPDVVVIRLYRDALQTPVSPASPTEPDLFAPPKQLRKEARDMLSDLAFRKQSSPNSTGNTSTDSLPSSRRRRFNKTPSPESNNGAVNRWESLVKEAEINDGNNSDDTLTNMNPALLTRNERLESTGNSYRAYSKSSPNVSPSNSSCSRESHESRPSRPNFLDLSNSHSSSRKSRFTPPHEEEDWFPSPPASRQYESLDSVPQLTSTHSDTPAFSHLQPEYRSVNLSAINPYSEQHLTNTSSDHNIHGHSGESPPMNNTLLKWKGVLFTPDDDEESGNDLPHPTPSTDGLSSTESVNQKIVTIDLNRGWNSRLGFSLQGNGEQTTVIAIYEDSVAAKDGRLKVGDIVLEINDTDVQSWNTESIIDHLRKIKGKVFLKVVQNAT